ncbi:MAG: integration host factor subunit beta [Alphaproteobacteria bacterium GM7ARS4]|nr:integration host factor subunit beta [Alphaproteobacteria bacterium GM7ARS4]
MTTSIKKSDIIEELYRRHKKKDGKRFTRKKTSIYLDHIFDHIADALEQGRHMEIRGFGTLYTKQQKARIGRNPKTGETVPVAPKRSVRFRMSHALLQRLNDDKETP